MTAEAKWVINCIAETKGRYGQNIVIGTLLGANRARLKELGTVNYKSYGALKEKTEAELKNLLSKLILEGYVVQTQDQYSVLRIGEIEPLRNPDVKVIVKVHEEEKSSRKTAERKRRSTDALTGAGCELFEKLRSLRLEIARKEAMPPYIIFSDKTLIDMCVKLPQSVDDMQNVSGVGTVKCQKYGEAFAQVIRDYLHLHPDAVCSMAQEQTEDSSAGQQTRKAKKPKKVKSEFYLMEKDAESFRYAELYYISDIKEELNRICTTENVKKVTVSSIWQYLMEEGYTEEIDHNGSYSKVQTQKGLDAGIVTVEKTSTSGFQYTLLQYPPVIQQIIVRHFVQK